MSVSSKQRNPVVLLEGDALARTLVRLAHQIREQHPDLSRLALVGVCTRGVPIARRLAAAIEHMTGVQVPVHAIDVTPYRDDVDRSTGGTMRASIPADLDVHGRSIVLVDDVLYTGRTARAALDALIDLGRPARVQLAVLVDRGHRELPIKADYVGKNLPSSRDEEVQVRLVETDGADRVLLVKL